MYLPFYHFAASVCEHYSEWKSMLWVSDYRELWLIYVCVNSLCCLTLGAVHMGQVASYARPTCRHIIQLWCLKHTTGGSSWSKKLEHNSSSKQGPRSPFSTISGLMTLLICRTKTYTMHEDNLHPSSICDECILNLNHQSSLLHEFGTIYIITHICYIMGI